MLKKYGLVILFSIFIMLAGVMLLSLQDEIKKVDQNIEDDIEDGQEADAETASVGFTITNVYGTQNNSDLGATFNYKLRVMQIIGKEHDSASGTTNTTGTIRKNLSSLAAMKTRTLGLSYNYLKPTAAKGLVKISKITGDNGSGREWIEDNLLNINAYVFSAEVNVGKHTDPNTFSNIKIYWIIECPLNNNSGTGGSTTVQYDTYNNTATSITLPTKTGYTFKGYYTSTSGGTQVINQNGNWQWSSDSAYPTTLYAQWEPATYKVNINILSPNGVEDYNSGSISWTNYWGSYTGTNEDVQDGKSNCTRTGSSFTITNISPAQYMKTGSVKYYYDNIDTTRVDMTKSGKNYILPSSFNFNPSGGFDITIEIKMLYDNYTLTFNGNKGDPSIHSKSVQYGQPFGTLPTATRLGYNFVGWFTEFSGGSQVTESTIMDSAGKTVYAHWQAKSYQATFDDQGGKTNFVDMSNVKSGTITNSGSVTTLVTGGLTYTYDTSTNILTVNGTQTASTVFSFAIINDLVAGDEYTLTMEYISGTPYTTNGCEVLEVYNKSIQTLPERNKYDFNFPASGKTSITLKITEYAQENGYALACRMWRNTENRVFNNYKVKFTITQKTGEAKKVRDVTYDSVLTPVSIPTKYGYNFAGYYTQANGKGEQYYDSTGKAFNNKTWDIANNATLYAKWTAKTNCVLTFNANGGKVSPSSRNQTYNAVLGTLPIPTKPGYMFTGWYTSTSGGSEVTSSTKMTSLTMTIYAHWAETWAAKGNYSEVLYIDTDGYFQIASAEDLARLIFLINYTTRSDVLTFKYKLTNHIDMSKYYWEPIGTASRPFSSAFNGNGYTIYGIHTISQSLRRDNGGDNSGLFGVTKNAAISNLHIKDAEINGKNSVGGIIGSATNSTIKSVAIEGQINGQANIGGIAGTSSGTTINDCLIIITGTTSSTNNGLYTGSATLNNTLYRINGIQGKSSGTFENWVYVDNMEYPLPSGLSWLASGGEIDDKILKLWSATNLIPNGDMEGTGWNVNGSSMSYTKEKAYSGEYSVKIIGTTSVEEVLLQTSTGIVLDPSHKYYVSIYGYQDQKIGNESVDCYWPIAEPHMGSISSKSAGQWQHYSWLVTRTSFTSGTYPLRFDFNNQKLNTTIYYDNAKMIDLTAIFGAGNEPSQAWLDEHAYLISLT